MRILVLLLFGFNANAETYYTFKYKTPDQLKVSVSSNDFFEARTKASKECFRILTKGVYPGEEKGLDFIDICSNPEIK